MKEDQVLRGAEQYSMEDLTQDFKALFITQPKRPCNVKGKKHKEDSNQNAQKKLKEKTRYFVIKEGDLRSLEESISRGVWNFNLRTANKLKKCFEKVKRVLLIFSLDASKSYQGYAELKGLRCSNVKALQFASKKLTCMFPIMWLESRHVSSCKILDLCGKEFHSQLNAKKDGEEISRRTWIKLFNMWYTLPLNIGGKSKKKNGGSSTSKGKSRRSEPLSDPEQPICTSWITEPSPALLPSPELPKPALLDTPKPASLDKPKDPQPKEN